MRPLKTFQMITPLMAIFILLGIMAWSNSADAAEGEAPHSLAKQSQNPISSLISVPFEQNINFDAGPEDTTDYNMLIKPVIPMGITENWNLVNRVILPVISQGKRGPGQDRVFGLGDITYQGFFSPKKPGKLIWGVGPQIGIPTGMDRATSDQWTLGPTAVGLIMPGKWVIGALVSNVWNIGSGYNNAPNVNAFSLQPFANYNMGKGWYVVTAPLITANWKADSDNVWTVPFGGGFGRVFKIGNQHVNLRAAGYYNATRPDQASPWSLQFTFSLLFPKKKK